MNEKKYSIKEHFRMLLRGYKLMFTFSKKTMVWRCINSLCQQLPSYWMLYMSALVINELIAGKEFMYLLTLALVTISVRFLLAVAVNIIERIMKKEDSIMRQIVDLYYFKKQNRMEYRYLDDADITYLRARIANANDHDDGFMRLYWGIWFFLDTMANLILSVSLSVSLFVTFSAAPQSGFLGFVNTQWSSVVLGILILCNVAISVFLSNRSTDYEVMRSNKLSKMYQVSNGYRDTSFERDSKIFGLGYIAIPHIRRSNDPKYRSETATHLFWYSAVKTVAMAVMNCVLYVFVGAKAYMGIIGIGNIMLYHGTIQKFIDACGKISWWGARLFKNNVYMQDIFDFVDLSEEHKKGDKPLKIAEPMDIEFRNVTFKYPKTEVFALKNVSCTFRAGQKIAIVGRNGSGKTTLIKLLCRLYEPDEGEILLGGVPISQYAYDDYIRLLSVVFQDFYTFSFTLGENVSSGVVTDSEKVMDCLEKVGLRERVAGMKNGIDSYLGGLYFHEGVNLSGGEMQKLAIARALYKDSPLVILDEPTASLDPFAESEIYSHFDNMITGKTAIYISHRLSSCRFCDNIAVFDNGHLVQYGNHDVLVEDENGTYAMLWNAQAQYYVEPVKQKS